MEPTQRKSTINNTNDFNASAARTMMGVAKVMQAYENIQKNGIQHADFSAFKIERALNHRAIQKVIEPIIQKYVKLESCLEIGCGAFPTRELLPSYSEEIKDKIVLTEYNYSHVKQLKETYPKSNVQFLDFKNITLERSSFQSIIMQDVLNIYGKDEILTAARQCHNTLAKGGYVVHFCKGSILGCTAELVDHQTVMFPLLDDQKVWVGVHIVKIKELKNHLKNIQSKDPNISTLLANPAWDRMKCLWNPELRTKLKESFEKLKYPHYKTITFEEQFSNTLKKCFEDVGFEMILSTTEKGVYFGARENGIQEKFENANFFETSYKNEKEAKVSLGALAPFKVYEVAEIHIFVCKKR